MLRHHQIICDDLWVRDGKILNPENVFFDERVRADVVVDCRELLLVPGFVDVQINGMIHMQPFYGHYVFVFISQNRQHLAVRKNTANATTTTPQPLYGPFSGTTQVSRCQKRTSGLCGARED